jgi:signal transduction histidine kinase
VFKRGCIIVLLCLTYHSIGHAQKPTQLAAGQSHYQLDNNLSYLRIQGRLMELEEVLNNGGHEKFAPPLGEVPNFGFTDASYWFHTQLKADPRIPTRWLLEIGYPLLDQIDVHIIRNGINSESYHTGDLSPLVQRPIKHRLFLFPLEVDAAETIDLYIRINTESAVQLPLNLWDPDTFYEQDEPRALAKAFVAGTLVIMFFYNLFLFFTIRDSNYLHYVGLVAMMLLFYLSLNGLGYLYVWSDQIFISQRIMPVSISGLAVSAGLFTQVFLKTKTNTPTGHKILAFLTIGSVVIFFASFFLSYSITVRAAATFGGLLSIVCMGIGLVEMKTGYTPARYYTLAWLFLYSSTVLLAMSKFGIIQRTTLVEQSFEFAMVLQVLLFSFALGDRINQIQKEKVLAQETALQQYEKYSEAMKRNEALRDENLRLQSTDTQSLDLLEMERGAFKGNAEIRSMQILKERKANLGTLVSGMLHDINNPLNQILTSHESLFSEISALETALLSNMADDEASEATINKLQKSFKHMHNMLEYIELAGRRIDSLNKGFITYSKISSDPVTNVHLDELVLITRQVVNSRIKSFQLDFDIGPLPKLTVCPSEVCFILSILLTNAADALEAVKAEHKDRRAFFDGKISVKARTDTHKEVAGLIISVEDNGGGMSTEEWDRFLEPYMTSRSQANSGLGLTICKVLVQKNRGQMWLADAPLLGGARIEIFFPAS